MTNGLGDGLRSYVESQVKNIEGDAVIFVRRKIDRPEGAAPRGDTPAEYKEEPTALSTISEIDPSAQLVTLPQMESVVSQIPEVKTVTPRYEIGSEFITLDGQKKYQAHYSALFAGLRAAPFCGRVKPQIFFAKASR